MSDRRAVEAGEADPGSGQILEEGGAREIGELVLAASGERVAAFELGVDPAGMAHHERSPTGSGEESAKLLPHARPRGEPGGAAEAVVGRYAGPSGPSVQAAAQEGEDERLAALEPAAEDLRQRLAQTAEVDRARPADPHGRLDDGIAHRGQDVHVLVPVDEAGRPAERALERFELAGELLHRLGARRPVVEEGQGQAAEGGEPALGRKTRRRTGRFLIGQGQVQAHVDPVEPGPEPFGCLGPAGKRGHAGGGGQAPGRHEFEDPLVHPRREPVIVGTEDERSGLAGPDHRFERH